MFAKLRSKLPKIPWQKGRKEKKALPKQLQKNLESVRLENRTPPSTIEAVRLPAESQLNEILQIKPQNKNMFALARYVGGLSEIEIRRPQQSSWENFSLGNLPGNIKATELYRDCTDLAVAKGDRYAIVISGEDAELICNLLPVQQAQHAKEYRETVQKPIKSAQEAAQLADFLLTQEDPVINPNVIDVNNDDLIRSSLTPENLRLLETQMPYQPGIRRSSSEDARGNWRGR
jgi:hypothetical protein